MKLAKKPNVTMSSIFSLCVNNVRTLRKAQYWAAQTEDVLSAISRNLPAALDVDHLDLHPGAVIEP